MQLLISDANILIDMEEGNLLAQMFQLPYSFSIPDIFILDAVTVVILKLKHMKSKCPLVPSLIRPGHIVVFN